ncbi:MAG: hypothetical protein V4633_13310 [Pseudomonadota bacterium]
MIDKAPEAERELLDDALSTVLWLQRRLPKGYGVLPFVERTIKALGEASGVDVREFLEPLPASLPQAEAKIKASEAKTSFVSNDRSNEIAAVMPNGVAVTNVYEAYDAGLQHSAALSKAGQGGEARDAARWRYIEDNATTHGGGTGFMISCWVPVDHEDMGCGIDAAIAIHTQGEAT